MQQLKQYTKAFVSGFAFVMPVSVAFFDYVGYISTVSGDSMQPVLNPKSDKSLTQDIIYLSRWSLRNSELRRGDIVSLDSPRDPGSRLVKRIIALEGDTVKTLHYKNRYVKIPEGHCWVEGDHHAVSMDSNTFGPVSVSLIHARASHVVWPKKRWQRLDSALPHGRQPLRNNNDFADLNNK